VNINSFLWIFNTSTNIQFTAVTNQLDALYAAGYRVLAFYSPYNGDPSSWLGCDPVDFYATPPQNGSLQDWDNLVAAAHARKMKVVSYFVNDYVDINSAFFQKAETEYAAGNRTSEEVSAIHWASSGSAALPNSDYASNSPSAWQYSQAAGAYYWALWGMPAFDFSLAGAGAEVAKLEEFWLGHGMDGFMFDASAISTAGKQFTVTLPKAYTTTDKWLTFEVTQGSSGSSYGEFGLTSWFNYQDSDTDNDYTVSLGQSASQIENRLKYGDIARSYSAATNANSVYAFADVSSLSATDALKVVQEAAFLGGAGIYYNTTYASWTTYSATLQVSLSKVLVALNSNPALVPSAIRSEVALISGAQAYAMKKVSADKSQTALLIYNFSSNAENITVNLAGTGIATSQTPLDLYAGVPALPITSSSYAVNIPGYGFKMLQVQ
jgi:hypothetical protein